MNRRILIVDDEAGIRDVFSEILTEEGYEIQMASNGMEGMQILEKNTFDLIILDKKMPLESGYHFVEKIKASGAQCKILLITGSPSEPSPAGVDGFLLKPCGVDELIQTVKKLLSNS